MTAAVMVPASVDPWPQAAPLRVEYLNRSLGSRCLVYFDDIAAARAFAAEHILGGQPCTVQSKAMAVTHEVKSCSPSDPDYIYWCKRFGNLESAKAEFDRGTALAAKAGGAYKLIEVGRDKPVASFTAGRSE